MCACSLIRQNSSLFIRRMEGHGLNPPPSRWAFLAPWTALLVQHKLRVKTTRIEEHSYRYQFDSIYLNLQRNVMLDGHLHRGLEALAEAVHLVATALSVDPAAWKELLVNQCDCGVHIGPIFDGNQTLTPRFEFDCKHYPGELLVTRTGLVFFEARLSAQGRSPAFHAAMRQLSVTSPTFDPSLLVPVPFKINLSLWNEDEGIMLGFLEFVRKLKPYQLCNHSEASQSWSFVECIDLDLTGPEVCSDVVRRTLLLIQDAPFVHVSKLTLDPKHVSCSDLELRELLTELTAMYPKLILRLDDVLPESFGRYDLDGSDSSSDPKIKLVANAIASTRSDFLYLSLGHLMTKTPLERDRRRIVWDHLFGTLLDSQSHCSIETLSLASHRVLTHESDAGYIKHAAESFPGFKTPTRLMLGLTRADQASVHAIISALGGSIVDLCLYDRERPIPSETVDFILGRCPKLVALHLDNVSIDSMEVFFGLQSRCQLSRLLLSNAVVKKKASFTTFLTRISDVNSTVGNLSELVLARDMPAAALADKLVLGHDHIQLISQALRSNGRIHTLEIDVDSDLALGSAGIVKLYHGRPAAVRRAPLSLAAKLALLSVLSERLSGDVLREVFSFAADCLPRFVHVKPTSW